MHYRGETWILLNGVDERIIRRLDEILRALEPRETLRRRLYSYQEAALALGVSTKWLQRRVRRKSIPFRQVGGYVRFLGCDIEAIRAGMARGPDKKGCT
jgi:excisionase family DNA binding protein